MNNKQLLLGAGAALLAMSSLSVQAVPVIGLVDYSFNIDGAVSEVSLGDPVPAGVNIAGFDDITGLGSITATITGAGAHTFDAFFDHEIDEVINGFTNENGLAFGTAAAGQSWEIDEPGYVDGDIYENFQVSGLDNGVGTSIYGDVTFPDDVSMAMGWDFTLAAGETATITLTLSDVAPAGGFFLAQTDLASNAGIYLSSALSISGGGVPTPEPAVAMLLGLGLAGMAVSRRRAKKA